MATATRPTVLSVDDEAGIRDAICLELEDDFDVVTTASGMQLGAADYVTKPWEHGEVVATIQRILREVDAPPGVLLVSDDAAALVPVALALEGRIRVRAMSVAAASASNFAAQVVVLHAPDRSKVSALSALSARFPNATTVWVTDESPQHIDKTLSDISANLGRHGVPRLSRVVLAAVELMVRFREAFGLTAGAYYVRLRIAVACRLLRDTDEKMEDIAQQVGYSGAANLSRAFKEVMGMRPGEFRRSSV